MPQTIYKDEFYKGYRLSHCTQNYNGAEINTCDAYKEGTYIGRVCYTCVSSRVEYWTLYLVDGNGYKVTGSNNKPMYRYMVDLLKGAITNV